MLHSQAYILHVLKDADNYKFAIRITSNVVIHLAYLDKICEINIVIVLYTHSSPTSYLPIVIDTILTSTNFKCICKLLAWSFFEVM